jgi:hypothetical protein
MAMGLETMYSDHFDTRPEHAEVYELIEDHPEVFGGFYAFEDSSIDQKRRRIAPEALRKPLRNEYDQ